MLFRIKRKCIFCFTRKTFFGKPQNSSLTFLSSLYVYKMSEILSKSKRCGAGTRAILPPRELNGRETKKCVAKSRAAERKRTSK